MNGRHYASSESESSETSSNNQNTYCIFLHIVEGKIVCLSPSNTILENLNKRRRMSRSRIEAHAQNLRFKRNSSVYIHWSLVGIGFNIKDGVTDLAEHRRNRIVLNVSLNGVKFEVEGHSLSNETATIFNSNCIWECDLCDIKRLVGFQVSSFLPLDFLVPPKPPLLYLEWRLIIVQWNWNASKRHVNPLRHHPDVALEIFCFQYVAFKYIHPWAMQR